MTLTELKALPNAELDRRIAVEVCGWINWPPSRFWMDSEGGVAGDIREFSPSADRNDLDRVEQEIERQGLVLQYTDRLCDVLKIDYDDYPWKIQWAIRRTSPRDCCIAAIMAKRN